MKRAIADHPFIPKKPYEVVRLKGGPLNGRLTLSGTSKSIREKGHRYDKDNQGDFIYVPENLE